MTAPDVERGCGWENSSHYWVRKLLVMPSSPAGRTALSCCLERQLVYSAKLPLGTTPDRDWDWCGAARVQECPAESAYCSWSALLQMGGCLMNRRMADHHGTRLPHHHRHLCRHCPQTPPHQKIDVPPVPQSHPHAHHFLLFLRTEKNSLFKLFPFRSVLYTLNLY